MIEEKIDYCFHTHTSRCGHAKGTDEEYVLAAIEHGVKRLGFSDHVMIEGLVQYPIRGNYELLEDYISSVNSLKEKYKDQVEIHLGFEAEYSKRFLEYYKSLLDSKKIEYLILGQHFNFDEGNSPKYLGDYYESVEELNNYVDHLIEGMETGLYTYVAHPDLFVIMFKKWNEDCDKATRRICEAAQRLHLPLEINAHASKFWDEAKSMIYPYPKFWEIVGQYDINVVIGYDAHAPYEIDNDLFYEFELINRFNLKFLPDFNLKK